MANRSKEKGSRREREIVDLHKDIGVGCSRVPLSGAVGGDYSGDIRIANLGTGEVKSRANGQGFATLERWLGQNAALFLRRDRAKPIVVLSWETYAKLIQRQPS